MEYKNKDLQQILDSLDSQVKEIEENPHLITERKEFKFFNNFYHEALNMIWNKVDNPKELLREIIKNSDVELKSEYIDIDDIIKAAEHYAIIVNKMVNIFNSLDVEWLDASHIAKIELKC